MNIMRPILEDVLEEQRLTPQLEQAQLCSLSLWMLVAVTGEQHDGA